MSFENANHFKRKQSKKYLLVEDIKCLKNEIKNYKIISTSISSETQKNNFSKHNFQWDNVFNNAKGLNHNLLLKHKRLVDELKEYKNNDAVFGV
ncbi:19589_t:CDS:2, partial [Racocetra persica]